MLERSVLWCASGAEGMHAGKVLFVRVYIRISSVSTNKWFASTHDIAAARLTDSFTQTSVISLSGLSRPILGANMSMRAVIPQTISKYVARMVAGYRDVRRTLWVDVMLKRRRPCVIFWWRCICAQRCSNFRHKWLISLKSVMSRKHTMCGWLSYALCWGGRTSNNILCGQEELWTLVKCMIW